MVMVCQVRGLRNTQMLKFGCIWSSLKYWTLYLMPLMVYLKVLFHPKFSIKAVIHLHC